jgi:hypothetical protein
MLNTLIVCLTPGTWCWWLEAGGGRCCETVWRANDRNIARSAVLPRCHETPEACSRTRTSALTLTEGREVKWTAALLTTPVGSQ